MNSRFLTIWATVSVGGSVLSMGAKDPLSAAIAWAVIGRPVRWYRTPSIEAEETFKRICARAGVNLE